MELPIASTPENTPIDDDPFDNEVCVVLGHGYSRRLIMVRDHILAHYCGVFRPMRGRVTEMLLTYENAGAFEMVLNLITFNYFIDVRGMRWLQQAPMLHFNTIIDIWDIGLRYEMPFVRNAAIDVFVNKIKLSKMLPEKCTVEYLWHKTPPGCTLRRLVVGLVREMWVPDGHKHAVWNDLVGGRSASPEDLVWAIEELRRSVHTVRIPPRATVRLLACEWHDHEKNDYCEGSEEYKLLPEHYLFGQLDR